MIGYIISNHKLMEIAYWIFSYRIAYRGAEGDTCSDSNTIVSRC